MQSWAYGNPVSYLAVALNTGSEIYSGRMSPLQALIINSPTFKILVAEILQKPVHSPPDRPTDDDMKTVLLDMRPLNYPRRPLQARITLF